MDLGHARGRDGGRIELGEVLLDLGPELLADGPAHHVVGERGEAVLEMAQLDDDVAGEEVGPGAHHLAQLDEGRPQALEGPTEQPSLEPVHLPGPVVGEHDDLEPEALEGVAEDVGEDRDLDGGDANGERDHVGSPVGRGWSS